MFMYTIRFAEDGFPLIRKHEKLEHAKIDFIAMSQYLTNPDKFPRWSRVVVCTGYEQNGMGRVTPLGVILEVQRYD